MGIKYTSKPCETCNGTGHRDYRWKCRQCDGTGATTDVRREVVIGPGWFDPMGHEMTREMRHDVAMLAACLGSKTWPPEA